MENHSAPPHVLLVCFPTQGIINPTLRLGKKLASKGALVTISCTEGIGNEMRKAGSISDDQTPVGDGFIRFEFFNDGCDANQNVRLNLSVYIEILERAGRENITKMVRRYSDENRRVSYIIGNPFIPWVIDVSDELEIPCSVLWVQSCAVFSVYHHFFRLQEDNNSVEFDLRSELQLPSMPVLTYDEIPSFLNPLDLYRFLAKPILRQFKSLKIPFCILMDTFQELESDVLMHMSKFFLIKTVGPLFKNLKVENSSEVRGDCLAADDCIEWLNSKPESSVVYISFGSIIYLKQAQVDEIAHGLLSSGVSFLWVMRPAPKWVDVIPQVLPDEFLQKVGERGKIVTWSPQEQVLAHSSISCFVTHCGWNSSVEALTCGVPVVAFPQWGDQVTNAKFMVDEFKVGIRLCRGVAENRLITRDEVEKCLIGATAGPGAVEMKKNALKWKKATEEAVAEGGSSDLNIRELVEEIKKRSTSPTASVKRQTPKHGQGNGGDRREEKGIAEKEDGS